MTNQAVGYIRVSTTKQADFGISLEAQRERIKTYCDANKLQLFDCFTDSGISGSKTKNRPALNNAIKSVCHIKGILVVYSMSRLARSTKDTILIGEALKKAGANLVSLTENIDTTTAMGTTFFQLLAVFGEMERLLISERTTLALHHIRASGRRISRHTPYGFDLSGDTLTPNASEQATIEEMRRMRGEGFTLSTISTLLTERGVPTKQGKSWRASSVQRIVERRAV